MVETYNRKINKYVNKKKLKDKYVKAKICKSIDIKDTANNISIGIIEVNKVDHSGIADITDVNEVDKSNTNIANTNKADKLDIDIIDIHNSSTINKANVVNKSNNKTDKIYKGLNNCD